MTTWYRNRWLVVCDDESTSFPSRRAAREYASRVGGHPANANIRAFGPYTNVDGIARVIDLGYPDPYRPAGRPAYRYQTEDD